MPAARKPAKRATSIRRVATGALAAARKYVPKGTGAKAGSYAGGALGSFGGPGGAAMGAVIGREMGKALSKITGVGSYDLVGQGHSVMNPRTAMVPRMQGSDLDIVVSKCEFITDIYAGPTGTPSAFNVQSFDVNPGLGTNSGGVFQWLPGVANNFQQYSLEGLVFEYRPTSGNATGANTALGTVMLSGAYDPTLPSPTSKSAMLNQQFAVSGTPANEILYPVECKRSEKETNLLNVRSGSLQSNQNQTSYDYLRFDIATSGVPTAGQVLGELWVTYKIRLSKYAANVAGNAIQVANYRTTGASNIVSAFPLGQGGALALTCPPTNTLPLVFDYAAAPQTITMPAYITSGTYLLLMYWRCTTPGIWVTPDISFANASLINSFFSPVSSGQDSNFSEPITTPATSLFLSMDIFEVTGPSAQIQLDTGSATIPASCTDLSFFITQVNPNVIAQGL